MARRPGAVLAALALVSALLLSGCSIRTPEELYTLPQPPPDHERLQAAINTAQQDLSLEYSTSVEYAAPLSGENTQTFQLLDMDNNGTQESAAAFFRVPGAEDPLMIYLFRQQPDGTYQVLAVIQGPGSAIESISYEDLDDKPGPEFVVLWRMDNDLHLMGVYSVDPGVVHTLLISSYSDFKVMDMDRDGQRELLLLQLDILSGAGTVDYYDYSTEAEALVNQSNASLSSNIASVSQLVANYVRGMVPALYVTSTHTDDSLVTDILVLGEEGLKNITLDESTGVSSETLLLRAAYGTDINRDAILELPHLTFLPEYNAPASLNYWVTTWRQYDAEGKDYPIFTTYHNEAGGWYLILPEHWLNQLTISRDDAVILGQRSVTFSRWSGSNDIAPEPFLAIYRFTGSNRSLHASQGSRFILLEDSSTIYAAEFLGTWDCGLDEDELLRNFNLIRTDW